LKIVRTAAAEEDLIHIWLAIAEHNPVAADGVLDGLESRWQILERHPQAGVARNDISADTRMLVEGNYLILYRIRTDEVEIVRIVHTRQKLSPETI
jgi:toxin ParE1/3/4